MQGYLVLIPTRIGTEVSSCYSTYKVNSAGKVRILRLLTLISSAAHQLVVTVIFKIVMFTITREELKERHKSMVFLHLFDH